jgi:cephalosporin-C deacetylase
MALNTLSYFDIMNMADKITCPTFASVALRDTVCPAKLYFAAYNRMTCEKEIKIYPFNGHEGGGAFHEQLKMRWVKARLG